MSASCRSPGAWPVSLTAGKLRVRETARSSRDRSRPGAVGEHERRKAAHHGEDIVWTPHEARCPAASRHDRSDAEVRTHGCLARIAGLSLCKRCPNSGTWRSRLAAPADGQKRCASHDAEVVSAGLHQRRTRTQFSRTRPGARGTRPPAVGGQQVSWRESGRFDTCASGGREDPDQTPRGGPGSPGRPTPASSISWARMTISHTTTTTTARMRNVAEPVQDSTIRAPDRGRAR